MGIWAIDGIGRRKLNGQLVKCPACAVNKSWKWAATAKSSTAKEAAVICMFTLQGFQKADSQVSAGSSPLASSPLTMHHITGYARFVQRFIPHEFRISDVDCPVLGFAWIVTNPPAKATFRPFSRFADLMQYAQS
jgi:hypothetical protein